MATQTLPRRQGAKLNMRLIGGIALIALAIMVGVYIAGAAGGV